jgi:hypothetical protein
MSTFIPKTLGKVCELIVANSNFWIGQVLFSGRQLRRFAFPGKEPVDSLAAIVGEASDNVGIRTGG